MRFVRICIVTETYWPEVNGVAMTLHRWVSGLVERGHTVQLIAPRHPQRGESLGSRIECVGVRSLPMPGYREVRIGLPAPNLIARLWRRCLPDVVYVATEGPLGSSAVTVANKRGIRVVSGYHTNFHRYVEYYRAAFLKGWVEKKLVRLHNRTDCTVVPTHWQRDMLLEMGIHNVAVIGRGVDTSLFRPEARSMALRQQWGASESDLVMVLVGRVAEEKNLNLTMDAYQRLRRVAPSMKFVLVGEGPALPRVRQQYPDVIAAGVQTGEDLAAHYASADLFLFSSMTETFGNVVLEAMSSGLGLVAFDYAAAQQHVCHGRSGLLAPFGDGEAFIAQSLRLVEDQELRASIRSAARRYAKTRSWDSIVTQLEDTLSDHVRVGTAAAAA